VAVGLDTVEGAQNLADRLVVDDALLCEHHDVGAVDGQVGVEDAFVGVERGEELASRAAAEAVAADGGLPSRFVHAGLVLSVAHSIIPPSRGRPH